MSIPGPNQAHPFKTASKLETAKKKKKKLTRVSLIKSSNNNNQHDLRCRDTAESALSLDWSKLWWKISSAVYCLNYHIDFKLISTWSSYNGIWRTFLFVDNLFNGTSLSFIPIVFSSSWVMPKISNLLFTSVKCKCKLRWSATCKVWDSAQWATHSTGRSTAHHNG